MKRIYVQSLGTRSWRELLADPESHWKRGALAMEIAVSWELAAKNSRGLPPEVARVLDQHGSTRGTELVFAFPEHRVRLAGGRRASQTDLWAVLKTGDGWVSMAVEGKAGEAFGPTVGEWLREASAGKHARIDALCDTIGLSSGAPPELRYVISCSTDLRLPCSRRCESER